MRDAVDGHLAWRELSDQAASLSHQPAPTVIHFARFEQPFLRSLAAGPFPLDVVCTRDIGRRLCPICLAAACVPFWILRSRGWRSRRSADHVEATAFVWQSWSACSRCRVCGARSTIGSPDRSSRPGVDAAFGRCRATCGFRCRMRPGIYRMLRTDDSVLSARRLRSIIGSTATFGSRTGSPSGRSRCCRRHARSRSTSHPVRSRPRSSSRTKSSGTDRSHNVALTIRTARCGSRRRISARSSSSLAHCPLGCALCSINSWHSLERLRGADVRSMGPQMQARSTPVTSGCARRILKCRASTSLRTRLLQHAPVARRSARPRR